MENWAYMVGMIIGAVAIGAVCWVWVRKQTFGTGGIGLSIVGVILVGLSVWKSVEVSYTNGNLVVRLQKLEQRLGQVAEASSAVTQEVQKLTDSANTTREEFLKLARTLEARGTLPAATIRDIRESIARAPTVDRAKLDSARRLLNP